MKVKDVKEIYHLEFGTLKELYETLEFFPDDNEAEIISITQFLYSNNVTGYFLWLARPKK